MPTYICKMRETSGFDFKPMIDFLPDGAHIAIVEHCLPEWKDSRGDITVGGFEPRILAVYPNDEQGRKQAEADLKEIQTEHTRNQHGR